jgi:AcrR family transcriptional regulator
MGRPPEHDELTKARLLEAAARLLEEEGAGAISVRRVAQEADTTTRAVYSLFAGKEGLLRQLHHEAAETMRRHHEAVPESDDPLAEVTALALAYRRAALEQPHAYGLVMGMVPGFRATREDRELAARSFRHVLSALARFVDAGAFAEHDPQALGLQLWAQVHGLATLELQGHLGTPATAEQRWRGAIAAHVLAYRQPTAGPPAAGATRPAPAR